MIELSVIIPTLGLKRKKNLRYFHKRLVSLKETLDSLDNIKVCKEVIVVCNTDDVKTIKFLESSKMVTRYCVNSQNPGVSRSWNIGAQLSKGRYLLFLNDDVEIRGDIIDRLCSSLDQDKSIGEIGVEGSFWKNGKHYSFYNENGLGFADVVSGFLFVTPRAVFDRVNGISIEYTPAGCEEIDYSYKVRSLGLKCAILPTNDIFHSTVHGISAKKAIINYLGEEIHTHELDLKNKQILFKKWFDGK